MEASNGVAARLTEHDRRLDAQDRARGKMCEEINDGKIKHTEIKGDVANIRDDIAGMKEDFGGQMKWIRRGMWVAAGTFLTLILMLAAVLVAVLSNGA